MKRWMLCLLLVLPASCAFNQAGSGPQAYCEEQAQKDPAVHRLAMENLGPGGASEQTTAALNLAKRRALQRCLRAQGVPVRGGVEPVVPQ